MGQAHEVAAQLLRPREQCAVVFFRKSPSAAEWRFFVQRNAPQKNGGSVQQDLGSAGFQSAKSDFIGNALVSGRNYDAVKLGMLRRPQLRFRREAELGAARRVGLHSLLQMNFRNLDGDAFSAVAT